MALSILPRPKRISQRKGEFRFSAQMPIILGPSADAAERLAGSLIADTVSDLGGPAPSIERHGKLAGLAGPNVQMFIVGRDEAVCPQMAALVGKTDLGVEGYAVDVTPKRVLVVAGSAAGLFYGAQSLTQLMQPKAGGVALPCCRIVDWPDFRYRGFMLDVSRFRVPTQQTLVELIFRLAAMKINVLQLYVEHTFLCRRHPDYSQGVSPLTAEQLSQLDELCAMLHIELQANQNSLGHMEHVLRQPAYAHLAERTETDPRITNERGRVLPQPWSFRLDSEQVYALLDDIYAEHLVAVRSPLVNLGCDEAWDMGSGRSEKLVARKGKLKAFCDHVRRISDLAKRYGKQAMIWDDMVRHDRAILEMLPPDVIPVFWHYGAKPHPDYQKVWFGSGRRHWMAPGCGSWQSITSRIDQASANIHWMTSIGHRGGAEGVLNTEWGDYGNFQTLGVSYQSIALGADLSWNVKPIKDTADFDRRFARTVFGDATGRMGKLYRLLGRTNSVFASLPNASAPFVLYWDQFPDGPWLSKVNDADLNACLKLAEQALELAQDIRRDPPAGVEDNLFAELISAAEQTIFACHKAKLAARVRAALAEQFGQGRSAKGKAARLPAALKREISKLDQQWQRQREQFEQVWLLSNEPSQIDYRLGLYAQRRGDFDKLLGRRARRKKTALRTPGM